MCAALPSQGARGKGAGPCCALTTLVGGTLLGPWTEVKHGEDVPAGGITSRPYMVQVNANAVADAVIVPIRDLPMTMVDGSVLTAS